MEHSSEVIATDAQAAARLPSGWLSNWPWATFLLPMVVYMLAGTLEPKPPQRPESQQLAQEALDETGLDRTGLDRTGEMLSETLELEDADSEWPKKGLLTFPYKFYPYFYSAKIALTLFAVVLVWPGYRTFPWQVSGLSVAVGVVGVVLWIALCHLNLEPKVIGPIDRFLGSFIPGLEAGETPSVGLMSLLGTGERSAYNPLQQLASTPGWAYTFLAIRFLGLALLVPVIEEFFLRGFLMRFVIHEQWWQVPFGTASRMAVIVGTAVPMLMHPSELLAAFVWFSMVTWLMVRTRSIWNCVVAHAVTNLLLGIYVVVWDQWQLM